MLKRALASLLCLCLLLPCLIVGTTAANDTSLPFTVSYGTTDGKTLSELTALTEEQLTDYQEKGWEVRSSTGLPSQIFTVDTTGVTAKTVTLSLGALTQMNERMALKVFNPESQNWDTVDTVVSGGVLSAEVAVDTYAADNTIKVMATLDYVANGSNRLIWSTDQQHYTKHADLNEFYSQIHEYMVEEYQKDEIAYVVNTGDIVDDTPNLSGAIGQWMVASDAFDILDEAGVPYGIETGNHDVGDYPANNYIHYLRFFPASRYEDKPWYGGTIDDNKCHYDLVTVGNVDFLFLYIGYGQGSDTAVIEWANDVLAAYPHRNAIICTHQYLKPTSLEQTGRAEIIHNTIVTQNPNVKMVLSGHYDGAAYKWRDADGRDVLEVVADYQFVQAESEEYYAEHEDPLHHIGSVPYCNGEGYIREVVIDGQTVTMNAFSPVTGGTNPFGARDDLSFTVDFIPAARQITTLGFTATTDKSVANPDLDTLDPLLITCDVPALNDLIASCLNIDGTQYSKESYDAFSAAFAAASEALKNNEGIAEAYTALCTARGALKEKTLVMDRNKLTTVADLELTLSNWENTTGPASLTNMQSNIDAEQLENGGFIAQKSALASIGWPAMKYTKPITFTPEDGKVYLYLDMEAGSTWSCFPIVIQDMVQYSDLRWNYVIEGSYRNDLDAGSGPYVGVYDVTQALIDAGVDPTKEMTISFVMNVVPGPVTVNAISVLTGEYPEEIEEPIDDSANAGGLLGMDTTTWIILIVIVVLAIAAITAAVLYKPKKKESTDEK